MQRVGFLVNKVYTVPIVERILHSYLDIVLLLEGGSTTIDNPFIVQQHARVGELPLGQRPTDAPWPFREHRHARRTYDGKARGRSMEELHCAVLDIEEAMEYLRWLSNHHDNEVTRQQAAEDFYLIYMYHILHYYTLDELAAQRNVKSRGSMQLRLSRAVKRLTRILEDGEHES